MLREAVHPPKATQPHRAYRLFWLSLPQLKQTLLSSSHLCAHRAVRTPLFLSCPDLGSHHKSLANPAASTQPGPGPWIRLTPGGCPGQNQVDTGLGPALFWEKEESRVRPQKALAHSFPATPLPQEEAWASLQAGHLSSHPEHLDQQEKAAPSFSFGFYFCFLLSLFSKHIAPHWTEQKIAKAFLMKTATKHTVSRSL